MPKGIYKHQTLENATESQLKYWGSLKGKPSNVLGKHWKLSEKHKKLLSEKMMGNKNVLGYKQTEGHKRNISISLLGHKDFGTKEGHRRQAEKIRGRVGKNTSNWKGGRLQGKNGYVYIYSPNHPYRDCKKYVREHRIVMEKELGRYLNKEEIVHHINGIKNDNNIENLRLFANIKEHNLFHLQISKNG